MFYPFLKYTFSFAVILLCSAHLFAQAPLYEHFEDIEFKHVEIPVDDGLTLRETTEQIYEDEEGIIWTVLSTGLFRYNGYSVVNVTNYLKNHHNLKFGNEFGTWFIFETPQIVWYGTRSGLFKIDLSIPSSKQIVLDSTPENKYFRNYITRLKLQNDTLFVGTGNGIYLINVKNNSILQSYQNDGVDYGWRMSSKNVHSLMPEIEPGYLWAALGDGLYRINLKTNKTERYESQTQPWDYSHYYFDGIRYDSILLMPSYGMGMVEFNMKTKKFTDYKIKTAYGDTWDYNCIRTIIPLSDSVVLMNSSKVGFGLFNRFTKKFKFIKTPIPLEENGAFFHTDRQGYGWSGRYGDIFRTTQPLIKKNLPLNHIIDISSFSANGELVYRPSLDGYENLKIGKEETNVQLIYGLTHSYIFEAISYEFKLDDSAWQEVYTPNKLELFNLSVGNHTLEIRALSENKEIAKRKLSFKIHQPLYQNNLFWPIAISLVLGGAFLVWALRNKRKREVELEKAEFENKLLELEAKALRSQINPHFIFNTLNSIKFYALKKSKDETAEFISQFSALIRQVLEYSKQSLIPLKDEIETVVNYIKIEQLRLRNSFDYEIIIAPGLSLNFLIPPMIIQPFIENSIWHGLIHKEKERKLTLEFLQIEKGISCIITDNGIGRDASKKISENKKHKSSLGIHITRERLENLSELYNLKSRLEIKDLYDTQGNPAGTQVVIDFQYLI